MKTIKFLSAVALASTVFVSCNDDETPLEVNENELFELVEFVFHNETTEKEEDEVHLEFHDKNKNNKVDDGEIEVHGTFKLNNTYHGVASFDGEHDDHDHGTKSKANTSLEKEDDDDGHGHGKGKISELTQEVINEADEHELFFEGSAVDNKIVTIEKTDTYDNGKPIGLEVELVGKKVDKGDLKIILKHGPKKPNDGTSADAGGSTDFELDFPIEVTGGKVFIKL